MRKSNSLMTLGLVLLLLGVMLFGCRSKEVESALIYINQQNDWDKAMEQLNLALQVNPADIEALTLRGEGYGRLAEYEKMNEDFTAAEKLMANAPSANAKMAEKVTFLKDKYWRQSFNKGVGNVKSEKLEDAGKDFQNCIIIDDKRQEAYKNLAYVQVQLNQTDAAMASYREVIKIDPKDVDAMTALANLNLMAKNFQEVIDLMDQVLAVDPTNVDAIAQKAMAYDYLGETDKAFAAYEEALASRPDDKDLIFNLGRLYFMKNEYTKAIDQFNKVIATTPDDFEANLNIGNAYLSMAEQVRKSLTDLDDKQLEKMPEAELKAKRDLTKKYFTDAIPYLEKAVSIKSDNAVVWNNLGVAYINAGMEDKGAEAFKKAEELK
ncbi:MAG: tetratricopeptide repeat protein [Candidatus Zhuqueibacterota bacterium]